MSNRPNPFRTRRGAAATLLGATAALASFTGAGPVPSVFQLTGATEDVSGNCDEAEHANDAACAGTIVSGGGSSSTSSTIDDTSTSSSAPGSSVASEVRTIAAGEAGSVMVSVQGSSLSLVSASPNRGWQVEVESASGREIEVKFVSGTMRVDVNVEIEDGQVRERVRIRDDADGTEIRFEDGVVVRFEPSEDRDDSSGPGSGDEDAADDSSGPGSGDASDDDSDDQDSDDSGDSDSDDDSDDSNSDDSSDDSGDDD